MYLALRFVNGHLIGFREENGKLVEDREQNVVTVGRALLERVGLAVGTDRGLQGRR